MRNFHFSLFALSALALGSISSSSARPPRASATAPSTSSALGASEEEFEVVPSADDLYRLLGVVKSGGLLKSAPRSGATRYEMALEAGRATLALASKRTAKAPIGEASLKALSDLLVRLRPELVRLDVDVDAALVLCRTSKSGASVPISILAGSGARPDTSRAASTSTSRGRADAVDRASVSLSQRLRVSAALSSLARDASDPFGGGLPFGSSVSSPRVESQNRQAEADASFDVSRWLRLRAGYSSSEFSGGPRVLDTLRQSPTNTSGVASLLASGLQGRTVGGGVDVDLLPSLTLSGQVSRFNIETPGAARVGGESGAGSLGMSDFAGTSIGGGARVSAFNNRLGLSLNWLRLLPEERSMVAQSAAGLNLDVGGDRMKLQVLYKQLFSDGARGPSNRVIAGGVNISF